MSALPASIEPVQRHRISHAEYRRMGEAGVLTPDARVELIEGEIIDMAPIGSRHATVVARLARALTRAVADEALVWTQNPLRLSDSEPQPDLVLLRPRADDYAHELPAAADALLVVEVADRSAAYDLRVKLPLYARHGIPEAWIIDLDAGTVRRYSQPRGPEYLLASASPAPGSVALVALPAIRIDLSAIVADI